jgi:limonene-1,2-epoxide hydrolase
MTQWEFFLQHVSEKRRLSVLKICCAENIAKAITKNMLDSIANTGEKYILTIAADGEPVLTEELSQKNGREKPLSMYEFNAANNIIVFAGVPSS